MLFKNKGNEMKQNKTKRNHATLKSSTNLLGRSLV